MSQHTPANLGPPHVKGKLSPLSRTGIQRHLPSEEDMHVDRGYEEEPVVDVPQDNMSVEDASAYPRDERIRAWFNVNANQNANPDSVHAEQMDTMNDSYADDDEASPTRVVEARFENVSQYRSPHHKTDVRISGGATMIRCLPWKILTIFHPAESNSMGFFVQCNVDSESQTWSCSAKATLILVAQQPNCKSKEMKIQHTFNHKENDWGFQNFISYSDLFNPENGYIRTSDDSICLQAIVKADAPHGADWDSKRHTGFVGLKNQGATCYLNSLLQALYCTNKLRSAVFLMPTESDDAHTSVPLALQRVFYDLQFNDRAVGTKKLTRSFGWATLDSFMQHDAQELCRVLLDNLENKMKGTSVEDVIPGLFCGKMLSYIRCLNVRYESKREENFYDIQLKVNGNRTIYDAFSEYVAKETLTQDNKYDAGEYGLQEAEKGVSFIRFPPVLYLQLMRFQYDFVADTNVKINDRFEFYYTLNLDKFLLQPDPNSPATYFLHAVLVHSGDNHGGHYVVYINPAGNNVWYQFDDDVVCRCSPRDAIYMNYGGSEDPDMRPCTNAYMLVYIAESAREDVLRPVSELDIPECLRDRFLEEQKLEEAKRVDKERVHLYMLIYLLLEEDFYHWQGPELCNQEMLPGRMLRVPKQISRAQLIDAVAKALSYPTECIRLWHFRPRRKTMPVHLAELIDSPLQYNPKDAHMFYVQYLSPSSGIPASIKPAVVTEQESDKRLFFAKYFDPTTWSLNYCGHVELNGDDCLFSLEPILKERAGLPKDCHLVFYQDDPKLIISEILQLKVPVARLYKREVQGQLIYFQVKSQQRQLSAPFTRVTASPELGKDALNVLSGSSSPGHSTDNSDASADTIKDVHAPEAYNGLTAHNAGALSISGNGKGPSPIPDPSALHKMAILPNGGSVAFGNPMIQDQPYSIMSQCAELGDPHSIHAYFASYVHQVEVLLVDKMRASDPGILLRVATNLSYWDFANLVAAYLSTSSDRLQFFRSHQAPITSSALAAATTPTLVNTEVNSSPVGSDVGSGNMAVSVDGLSPTAMDHPVNPQTAAARAAGFTHASPYMENLIGAAAAQGLAAEPPGPAIPSTHHGPMRDFLLPFSVSSTNSSWASDPVGTGFGSGGPNMVPPVGAGAVTPDKFPAPLSRYCGVKVVNRSPLGLVTFPPPRRIYYAHLAIKIDELETMRQVRVIFVDHKLSAKAELLLSVPQNGLVFDLLKEASRHLSLAPDGSGELRLFEVSENRILQEIPHNLKLSAIPQSTLLPQTCVSNPIHSLRIEEVPVDELNLKPDETIVFVSHFDKELRENFGIPFTVRIRDGEHYSAVRERIRRRLDVPEKEFERWRFAVMFPTEATYIPKDDDPVVRIKIFNSVCAPEDRPYLSIEHKPSKRPRYAPNEKPIKIHN